MDYYCDDDDSFFLFEWGGDECADDEDEPDEDDVELFVSLSDDEPDDDERDPKEIILWGVLLSVFILPVRCFDDFSLTIVSVVEVTTGRTVSVSWLCS